MPFSYIITENGHYFLLTATLWDDNICLAVRDLSFRVMPLMRFPFRLLPRRWTDRFRKEQYYDYQRKKDLRDRRKRHP